MDYCVGWVLCVALLYEFVYLVSAVGAAYPVLVCAGSFVDGLFVGVVYGCCCNSAYCCADSQRSDGAVCLYFCSQLGG